MKTVMAVLAATFAAILAHALLPAADRAAAESSAGRAPEAAPAATTRCRPDPTAAGCVLADPLGGPPGWLPRGF